MPDRPLGARLRTLEGRLWTGRTAHLVGGALDLGGALARYAWRRARERLALRLR
jgi:hypothetical protein